MQRARQFRAGSLQFHPMRHSQFAQDCAARGCQPHPDLAPVIDPRMSGDSTSDFQPIHQFYCAVVLNEQPESEFSNGRFYAGGKALHGEQELVLLRLNAVFFRRRLAEMKKAPDLPSELGQIPVLIGG